MEHRYSNRTNGGLRVLIYKYNCPIAIGQITNGSYTGIFVETEFADIECEHQLKLTVATHKNGNQILQAIEMNVIVIHKSQKDFGAEIEFSQEIHGDMFMELLRNNNVAYTNNVDVRNEVPMYEEPALARTAN